jgi:hypothetical protein
VAAFHASNSVRRSLMAIRRAATQESQIAQVKDQKWCQEAL